MTQLPIQQALSLAVGHHQAGRLAQAEQLYRQVLAQQPANADAMHMLGVIAYQVGHHDSAADLIRRAIAMKPDLPGAHSNLGMALSAQAHLDEAIAAYRQAIALKPTDAEAHYNLGIALAGKAQLDEAIAAYRHAIAINPNHVGAHGNLGNALMAKGQMQEAIAEHRRVIAINPDLAEAHNNLAAALNDAGEKAEAITVCRRAIALNPDCAESYHNLGIALWGNGQDDDAIAAYRQALALNPDLHAAHTNLANAFCQHGRLDDAIAALRQATGIKPAAAQGQPGAAPPAISRPRVAAAVHSILIFAIHLHPDYDPARLLDETRKWAQRYEAPLAGEIRPHDNNRDPDRRLKIGYVSADFFAHAVASSLLPVLPHHDPRNVEVYCYSNVQREDEVTEKFKRFNVVWRNVLALSDAELAKTIRRDGIDILVDLALHTANNRLPAFARKPAPVQVSWCGYPGTTGMTSIDYRLTDRFLDPIGQNDQFYSERSIRLPNSFWCYQPLIDDTPDVNDLPALSNGHMTFGCFNNFAKVTPQSLQLWIQVLKAVPDSRLLILSRPGSHRDAISSRFQENGIAPDRLEFVSRAQRADYYKYFHRVDLCLDPIPYPGHISSLDAMWMGVPSVTLSGNTAASRGGLSILSNVGLPEFIARTSDEYIAIAAGMSACPEHLSQLRQTLRSKLQSSPLMNGHQFAADLESAYRQMWRTWCAAGKPVPAH